MIDVLQGASVKLAVTLKDSQGTTIDPASSSSGPDNVLIELYPEKSHEVLARYAITDPQDGNTYGNAAINGDEINVFIDGADTAGMPIGKIVGKFIVTYANADFSSGYETLISRGVVLNVLP